MHTLRKSHFISFRWRSRTRPECSLYVAVSNVLAVYNIKPPIDDAGNTGHTPRGKHPWRIPIVSHFLLTSGVIIRYFMLFKCVIEPRSNTALALVQCSESSFEFVNEQLFS